MRDGNAFMTEPVQCGIMPPAAFASEPLLGLLIYRETTGGAASARAIPCVRLARCSGHEALLPTASVTFNF